jgi:hypothetical protein
VLILALPPVAANGQQTGTPATSSAYQAPVISDSGDLKGPRQPIFFRHDVHAGQYQMPCMYCHYSVAISSEPGIPSLQTCMGCHLYVSGGTRGGVKGDSIATRSEQAEVQKLRTSARTGGKPPEWTRIHALPGFARFPHMRHIKALGTQACATCHGEVQKMAQVSQVSTLRMGWCVRCHIKNNVTRDCSVCHY